MQIAQFTGQDFVLKGAVIQASLRVSAPRQGSSHRVPDTKPLTRGTGSADLGDRVSPGRHTGAYSRRARTMLALAGAVVFALALILDWANATGSPTRSPRRRCCSSACCSSPSTWVAWAPRTSGAPRARAGGWRRRSADHALRPACGAGSDPLTGRARERRHAGACRPSHGGRHRRHPVADLPRAAGGLGGRLWWTIADGGGPVRWTIFAVMTVLLAVGATAKYVLPPGRPRPAGGRSQRWWSAGSARSSGSRDSDRRPDRGLRARDLPGRVRPAAGGRPGLGLHPGRAASRSASAC